jgi:excisionase family DNA binding protein
VHQPPPDDSSQGPQFDQADAMMLDNVVSVPAAARALAVSRVTVHAWCVSGRLAGKMVAGRYLIPRSDVERVRGERRELVTEKARALGIAV